MRRLTLLGFVFLAVAGPAFGQTWNGGGANDNWSTGGAGGNWTNTAAPVSSVSTAITFGGTTRLTPVQNIATPFTLNTLTFAAGAGAFNLGGNALSFDGASRSIVSNTASNVTIGQNVNFVGTGSINAASTGAIAFTGTTTIEQGTVTVLSNNVTVGNLTLGNGLAGAVTLDTGANTLKLAGTVTYDGGAFSTGGVAEIKGQIDLNGAARNFTAVNPGNQPAYDLIVSAKVIGAAGSGLTVPTSSLGNILFTNQNTYTGPTTFNNNQGAVYLGVNNALPTTSAITLGATAFLSLRTPLAQGAIPAADYNHQFASLTGGAADAEIRFGDTSTLTVGDASFTTYAGIFTQSTTAGTPSLVKTGTGRLTLSGNSAPDPFGTGAAFAGTVSVNQGTLWVRTTPSGTASGTGRATVLVNAGGTLAGNGALVPDKGSQAANTITINGTIAPDADTAPFGNLRLGAATAKSTVTVNGTYRVDLSTLANDQLTINGSLALGASSILNASGISSTPGGGTNLFFTIATFDSGSLTGTFNLAGSSIPAGSSIQYNAASIVLVVPVPEPGTILGLSAGAFAVAAALRRRVRTSAARTA